VREPRDRRPDAASFSRLVRWDRDALADLYDAHARALDELAPIYLKTLPLDPFPDRPPRYVRREAGFELRADLPARYRGPVGEWTVPR